MKKILLQTTIQHARMTGLSRGFQSWQIFFRKIEDETGTRLFGITARDRENLASGDDRILSKLDETDFDQLWLFGVDVGGGLGGWIARRSADSVSVAAPSLLRATIKTWGFPFAHSAASVPRITSTPGTPNPIPNGVFADDIETPGISWPNYHSGSNGDFQRVT